MKKRNRITQAIVLLGLFSFVALAGCSDNPAGGVPTTLTMDPAASVAAGNTTYFGACVGCHGGGGTGSGGVNDLVVGSMLPAPDEYADFGDLVTYITDFMPRGPAGTDSCIGTCARDVAAYVLCTYNDDPAGNDIAEGCP